VIVICRLANRLLIRPQTSSWAPGVPFRGSDYVLIRSRGVTRPICRFLANETRRFDVCRRTRVFATLSRLASSLRLALGAQLANFSLRRLYADSNSHPRHWVKRSHDRQLSTISRHQRILSSQAFLRSHDKITAIRVLSCSRAARHLLMSFGLHGENSIGWIRQR
jgi:hypothetical protein